VSVASPPSFVELLSPCISAGPVAGTSALSRFCRSAPVIFCLAALMPPILRGLAFCLAARLAFELLASRLLSFSVAGRLHSAALSLCLCWSFSTFRSWIGF